MQFLDEISASVPALRRYARALTRNADRADDLVQDCLERAIRKQGLWAPTGPLQAWLFKMLLNLYRNDARHRRRRGDHVPIDSLLVEPAVPAPQPGRIALSEMSRAIDALPAGTLMSRLSRARAALRTMTGVNEEPRLRSVK